VSVEALREVHAEMMEPPEKLRGNAPKLKSWKPPVKRDIDWEGVLNAEGGKVGSIVGGPAVPRPIHDEDDPVDTSDPDQEPEFLTIGLIGAFAQRLCLSLLIFNLFQASRMSGNPLC
jgi:hypothetical protein